MTHEERIRELLESRGVIHREHGPRGRIVNIPSSDNRVPPLQGP